MMMPVMKTQHGSKSVFGLIAGVFTLAMLVLPAGKAEAKWLEKGRPTLPYGVFIQHLSGSVVLSLVLDESGHVRDARVLKSSGHNDLDALARDAASSWRLAPQSLVPTDLTKGRVEVVRFRNDSLAKALLPGSATYWAQIAPLTN